jgi:hypothetical protein
VKRSARGRGSPRHHAHRNVLPGLHSLVYRHIDKHSLTSSCVAMTTDSTAGYLVDIAHPSNSVTFTIANSPATT